jgi:hypothetical protein
LPTRLLCTRCVRPVTVDRLECTVRLRSATETLRVELLGRGRAVSSSDCNSCNSHGAVFRSLGEDPRAHYARHASPSGTRKTLRKLVLPGRIELPTSALPRMRSTHPLAALATTEQRAEHQPSEASFGVLTHAFYSDWLKS